MTLTELLSIILRRPRRDGDLTRVPALTFGAVTDPDNFLIYLVFECDLPFELQADAVRRLWEHCERIGHLALTTRRPDLYPAGYGVVMFGTPLGHTRDDFPPGGAAAVTTARWRQPFWDRYQRMDIWIDLAHNAGTPEALAAAALHEIGHGLGWDYSHVPTEYSPDWWALCRAGAIDAAARAGPWRAWAAAGGADAAR